MNRPLPPETSGRGMFETMTFTGAPECATACTMEVSCNSGQNTWMLRSFSRSPGALGCSWVKSIRP